MFSSFVLMVTLYGYWKVQREAVVLMMFYLKKDQNVIDVFRFLLPCISILVLAGCNTEDPDDEVKAPTLNEETSSESSNVQTNGENNEGTNSEKEDQIKSSLREAGTDDWEVETLAEDLEVPWAMEIHEGTIYMTDREGHILEWKDGLIEEFELQTSSEIASEGEGGLLGFVLTADFEDSSEGYAYYTFEGESGTLQNRVISITKENDEWVETDILLDDIPGSVIHNGGRIAVGPDDLLYVTTGDSDEPSLAQDENSLAGKILRMTFDGDVPEDNPIDNSYVYSFGHRNPQGLSWNDEGELYSSEHGSTAKDEINLIKPMTNYGWPVIKGENSEEGLQTPLIHSGEETWAPSGIAFWEDNLLVATLRGESLYFFDQTENQMKVVFEGEGRLRDVKVEEKKIYLLTNNTDGRGTPRNNDDRLLRLTLKE